MALMLPMLFALLFGGLEAGHFFWREHQLVKAAREGARFAGRQPMESFDCTAGTVTSETKNSIALATKANLTGSPTVAVAVEPCLAGSNTGLYGAQANGAPIVTVTVSMDYPSLLANLGFDAFNLRVGSSAQSAVMGL
jgi:Flp pilus assembly protein TadG